MTPVERHAELVYAESLFEKVRAFPSFFLSLTSHRPCSASSTRAIGSRSSRRRAWSPSPPRSRLTSHSLNMRTTIHIYKTLYTYITQADEAYTASKSSPRPLEDPSIDQHFRSGVLLGMGMSNIVLSLIPGRLGTIVEMFGYKGEREAGLEMLMRAGGWGEGDEPALGAGASHSFFLVRKLISLQPTKVFGGRSAMSACSSSTSSSPRSPTPVSRSLLHLASSLGTSPATRTASFSSLVRAVSPSSSPTPKKR